MVLFYSKQFIDKTYPGRHELIIGDSLISIPEYFKKVNILPENKCSFRFHTASIHLPDFSELLSEATKKVLHGLVAFRIVTLCWSFIVPPNRGITL